MPRPVHAQHRYGSAGAGNGIRLDAGLVAPLLQKAGHLEAHICTAGGKRSHSTEQQQTFRRHKPSLKPSPSATPRERCGAHEQRTPGSEQLTKGLIIDRVEDSRYTLPSASWTSTWCPIMHVSVATNISRPAGMGGPPGRRPWGLISAPLRRLPSPPPPFRPPPGPAPLAPAGSP